MSTTTSLRELISGTNSKVSSLALAALVVFAALAGGFTGAATASSHDVEVTVTDGNGNAVANATVEVIDTSDSTLATSGTTDSSGTFTASLSDGTYDVVVNAPDYDQASKTGISHTSGTLSTVSVSLDRSTGTIESTVTDSTGTAIENATLEVVDPSDGTVVMSAPTDSTGFAALTSVPTGTYDLQVSADGYESATNTGIEVTSGNVTVSDFSLSESTSDNTTETTTSDNTTTTDDGSGGAGGDGGGFSPSDLSDLEIVGIVVVILGAFALVATRSDD